MRTLSDYPTAASLRLVRAEGASRDLATDHIIAATGYRLAARSLPFLNHCCAISAASSMDPCCSPELRVLNSTTLFQLACISSPPRGVTRNSILILITPGGMVLDHPLFVGSLFARCSMAGVGKSDCFGGLLDGLKGRTGRPDLTIPPDKEFLVESSMAVSQGGLWMGFMRSAERFPERPAVSCMARRFLTGSFVKPPSA